MAANASKRWDPIAAQEFVTKFAQSAVEDIRSQVNIIVVDAVAVGKANQRIAIQAAKTPWGEKRQLQGRPSAGRVETGAMENAIGAEIVQTAIGVTGSWGWLSDYEKVYDYQESGTKYIAAAHSLLTSYVVAREYAKNRLNEIAKEVS